MVHAEFSLPSIRHLGNYCQMFGKSNWLKWHEDGVKADEAEKSTPDSKGFFHRAASTLI